MKKVTALFVLVILLTTGCASMFQYAQMENIHLGMTKEEVVQYLKKYGTPKVTGAKEFPNGDTEEFIEYDQNASERYIFFFYNGKLKEWHMEEIRTLTPPSKPAQYHNSEKTTK